MATRTEVTLIDDVDGSEAAGTVGFMLDGTDYEIDLSTGNSAAMRQALAQYVEAARRIQPNGKHHKTSKTRQTGTRAIKVTPVPTVPQASFQPAANGSSPATTVEVREWAQSQGIEVRNRGRIPAEVREKFTAATGRTIA